MASQLIFAPRPLGVVLLVLVAVVVVGVGDASYLGITDFFLGHTLTLQGFPSGGSSHGTIEVRNVTVLGNTSAPTALTIDLGRLLASLPPTGGAGPRSLNVSIRNVTCLPASLLVVYGDQRSSWASDVSLAVLLEDVIMQDALLFVRDIVAVASSPSPLAGVSTSVVLRRVYATQTVPMEYPMDPPLPSPPPIPPSQDSGILGTVGQKDHLAALAFHNVSVMQLAIENSVLRIDTQDVLSSVAALWIAGDSVVAHGSRFAIVGSVMDVHSASTNLKGVLHTGSVLVYNSSEYIIDLSAISVAGPSTPTSFAHHFAGPSGVVIRSNSSMMLTNSVVSASSANSYRAQCATQYFSPTSTTATQVALSVLEGSTFAWRNLTASASSDWEAYGFVAAPVAISGTFAPVVVLIDGGSVFAIVQCAIGVYATYSVGLDFEGSGAATSGLVVSGSGSWFVLANNTFTVSEHDVDWRCSCCVAFRGLSPALAANGQWLIAETQCNVFYNEGSRGPPNNPGFVEYYNTDLVPLLQGQGSVTMRCNYYRGELINTSFAYDLGGGAVFENASFVPCEAPTHRCSASPALAILRAVGACSPPTRHSATKSRGSASLSHLSLSASSSFSLADDAPPSPPPVSTATPPATTAPSGSPRPPFVTSTAPPQPNLTVTAPPPTAAAPFVGRPLTTVVSPAVASATVATAAVASGVAAAFFTPTIAAQASRSAILASLGQCALLMGATDPAHAPDSLAPDVLTYVWASGDAPASAWDAFGGGGAVSAVTLDSVMAAHASGILVTVLVTALVAAAGIGGLCLHHRAEGGVAVKRTPPRSLNGIPREASTLQNGSGGPSSSCTSSCVVGVNQLGSRVSRVALSLTWSLVALFAPNVVGGCVLVLRWSASGGAQGVAIVGLLLSVVLSAGLFVALYTGFPLHVTVAPLADDLTGTVKPFFSLRRVAEAPMTAGGSENSTPPREMNSSPWFAAIFKSVFDATTVLSSTRPLKRLYFVEEMVVGDVLAVVAGFRGNAACVTLVAVAFVVAVLHVVYLVAVRPYFRRLEAAVSAVAAATSLLQCIALCVVVGGGGDLRARDRGLAVLGVVTLVQAWLFPCQLVVQCGWAIALRHRRRLQTSALRSENNSATSSGPEGTGQMPLLDSAPEVIENQMFCKENPLSQ